jgi:hypothetical protein
MFGLMIRGSPATIAPAAQADVGNPLAPDLAHALAAVGLTMPKLTSLARWRLR